MTAARDPRVTPARPDIAAEHLRGKVEAARYAPGARRSVQAAYAPLYSQPAAGTLGSMLLFGETFIVYDDARGWAWGQSEADGYVGYVPSASLGECGAARTHAVTALSTHLYPQPDMKTAPVGALYMGSRVTIEDETQRFARIEGGLFLPVAHLSPPDELAQDYVAVAESFTGAPYLWGGRTVAGLDCSGLVQTALARAGHAAPRDSDQQEQALGRALPPDAPLQRGDLVFWKGHVGIMISARILLHANAYFMSVTRETLNTAIRRHKALGVGPPTSIRRIGG